MRIRNVSGCIHPNKSGDTLVPSPPNLDVGVTSYVVGNARMPERVLTAEGMQLWNDWRLA